MAKTNNLNDESLLEDQKKFRKYRKLLRQIEHLQLLNRPLNDEEKSKVTKRAYYREQLDKLNAYYSNNQMAYRENLEMNTTGDSGDHNDESTNIDDEVERVNEDDEVRDETNQNEEDDEQEESDDNQEQVETKRVNIDDDLDEICSRMEKIEVPKVTQPEPVNNLKKEFKVEEPKKAPKPKNLKLRTLFETVDKEDAHEDLIVCLDICVENNLIVTGSRDTTIKAWKFDSNIQKGCQLVQSFGGHSSPITCVKFWPFKYYQKSFENTIKQRDQVDEDHQEIDDREFEEAQMKLNQLEEKGLDAEHLPFIVSTSLDCTARIWCLKSAICLKEMYLYNPINRIDILGTTFVFGLDAGKVDYWKNLRRAVTIKVLDDDESICDVKIVSANQENHICNKVYSLSQNGMIKVFSVDDHGAESNAKVSYKQLHHSDIMDSMSSIAGSTTLSKRTFKCFELLSDMKIALIVHNQSFIVQYDLNNETSKPISTNVSKYGLTTCFGKVDNQILVNAYDIDYASSAINVFGINASNGSELQHVCTLQEDQDAAESSYCMTDLKCEIKKADGCEKEIIAVSCSSRSFKIWHAETKVEKSKEKTISIGMKEAKMSKLCSKISYLSSEVSGEESEDDEEDDSDNISEPENQIQKQSSNVAESKSRCSIQ